MDFFDNPINKKVRTLLLEPHSWNLKLCQGQSPMSNSRGLRTMVFLF